jgi:O-antigen/teichoic acid export membrane protein
MKNAFYTGLVIGILSGLWLFVMHWMGYNTNGDRQIAPYEYLSVLIPFVGLYVGVRAYRQNEMHGVISFLEALIQCFKTLIVGGVIAVFAGIVYINYISIGGNFADFSGRMFGALLVGLLFSLAVSLMLMNKSKAI